MVENSINRVSILGVQISAVNLVQAGDLIKHWIESKEKRYVCATPAHSVMDCVTDPSLYPLFNNSGMTTPDGMSIAWILRMQGLRHVERVAGSELMNHIFHLSAKNGWRHFLYGASEQTLHLLEERLSSVYKGVKVVGKIAPPYRNLDLKEDHLLIDTINRSGADIVWVGISSPLQEKWMSSHLDKLNASVLIGVGAAFDFLSGQKKRAPQWMQKIGMEWVFRFFQEPIRLWPRYRQYPRFVYLYAAQQMGWWNPENSLDGKKKQPVNEP